MTKKKRGSPTQRNVPIRINQPDENKSGKEMYSFLLNNWYFRTTYKNNQDRQKKYNRNVQNITMQYKLTLVAKKYRESFFACINDKDNSC